MEWEKVISMIEFPERHLRNSERGLFLVEQSIDFIVDRYHRISPPQNRKKSYIELRTYFLDDLSYRMDFEECLVGYISGKAEKFRGLPQNTGTIFSCKNYLVSGDYLFWNHPIVIQPDRKHLARIPCPMGNILITSHSLDQFMWRGERSEVMNRNYPGCFTTQRKAILVLYSYLRSAVEVSRQNFATQVVKHNGIPARYFTNQGWIFVIDENNTLRTCYEKGKIAKAGYTLISSAEE